LLHCFYLVSVERVGRLVGRVGCRYHCPKWDEFTLGQSDWLLNKHLIAIVFCSSQLLLIPLSLQYYKVVTWAAGESI